MKRLLLGLVVLAALGCDKKKADTGAVTPVREGDVGAVEFSYACAAPGDVQCNVDADLAPVAKDSSFPLLGAGTSFVVGAKWKGTEPAPGPLTTAGSGTTFFTVKTEADRMIVSALKPGKGALVASSGAQIVDLTTIEVHAIDHLKMLQASPKGDFKDGSISLGNGSLTASANVQFTFKFRVVPVDKDGTVLAGSLPVKWSSLDENVVKLTSPANDNVSTFVSGAAGQTKVHVTVGDKSADVSITVGS